jgi:secreted trypsin-like serine protease
LLSKKHLLSLEATQRLFGFLPIGSGQTCSNIPTWMKNKITFNGKIVGGMIATSSIPWQVQVRGSQGFCGGTILDEYTILSAAHCKITSTTKIVAGATALNSNPQTTQTIRVKNVINHPSFNSETLDFDYSIAKLTSPLSFNTNVKAACLPTANFVPGSVAVASGWGSIKNCKFVFEFNISTV